MNKNKTDFFLGGGGESPPQNGPAGNPGWRDRTYDSLLTTKQARWRRQS